MIPESDPTKWVNEWPLPGLSALDRIKIKAVLLKAHAAYHRTDWRDYTERSLAPMQQAFGGVANVLFEANLLNLDILRKQLPLFILESAAAGDWALFGAVPPDEERTEIFPGYLGSAARWQAFNERWFMLFAAEVAEWHSRLLDKSVETSLQGNGEAIYAQENPQTNRERIDWFILKMARAGTKVKRKDIWLVAGYKDATEFERFQRGDSRNRTAVSIFDRVFKMDPQDFLRVLKQKRI